MGLMKPSAGQEDRHGEENGLVRAWAEGTWGRTDGVALMYHTLPCVKQSASGKLLHGAKSRSVLCEDLEGCSGRAGGRLKEGRDMHTYDLCMMYSRS